jgi:lactate dehydrogenase-like 2-hydroxyacid dehydrogenase
VERYVNTEDLIDALQHGNVHAAGLDFYENEKNIFSEPHRQKY